MTATSLKNTLDSLGLPWVTVLLVAAMSTFIYTGSALWQTWTHEGPSLVTAGTGDGDGFVAGHDFVAFYSASQAILGGNADQVYDERYMKSAQHRLVGSDDVGYLAFMYPPTYMLMVSPLSFLSYFQALALWLSIPFLALLLALWRGTHLPEAALLLVAASPAVGQTLFAGQNGLLFAALLTVGVLLQDRRPLVAGALFGLAMAKPQIGIILLPALLFGHRWTILLAIGATLAVMAGLATAFFGPDVWTAYADIPAQAREWLAAGRLPWARMPTVYAALRLAGSSDALASLVQLTTALIVVSAVAWLWFRGASLKMRNAAMLAGIPLATPFLYDYDLPLMLTALALFVLDARSNGCRPGEKIILLLVWLQPAWWWTFSATVFEFSVAPAVYGLFFLAIMRRAIPHDCVSLPSPLRRVEPERSENNTR